MSNSAYDIIEMVKHDLELMFTMDSLCAVRETINDLLEELEEWEDADTNTITSTGRM